MGKSTLILILLAALGLGSLIGVSLVDKDKVRAANEETTEEFVSAVVPTGGAPVFRFLTAREVTVEHDDFGQPIPHASGENFIGREGEIKSETVTITLDVAATVEYKALMQQGDTITFRWATNGGEAYYDLHGHDESFGPEFFSRYEEGEGAERSGSIVAAYGGQHGWFWLNLEVEPITITLEIAGFYDELIEVDLSGD